MTRALGDLRVIEIGEMVSAPYAARLLADMGAEVIKIEPPAGGDRARRTGPFPADAERSSLFLHLNCNKLGITLDLFQPEGFALFERLLAQSDVLVHDVAPSDAERIGITYERLCTLNGRLILTSISPFGAAGRRDELAEDLNVWCASGAAYIQGTGDGEPKVAPQKPFGHPAGYAGGVHAASAIVGALVARDLSGSGEYIEVVLQDALTAMGFGMLEWPFARSIPTRLGEKLGQPMEAMQAKDGWVFVQAHTDAQFKALCELMGNPEWAGDAGFANRFLRARNWGRLEPLLEQWISQYSVEEVCRLAQERRISFVPVSTMQELLHSEQLAERGFFVGLEHRAAGKVAQPGGFAEFSDSPWEIRRPAPLLGEHNEEIYCGRLGIARARYADLRQRGVV